MEAAYVLPALLIHTITPVFAVLKAALLTEGANSTIVREEEELTSEIVQRLFGHAGAVPAMEILPPDVTPLWRATARDQSMRAQGFPVAGLGALAQADEQAYGLPSGYLSQTAQIESGGNPTASNPSGA